MGAKTQGPGETIKRLKVEAENIRILPERLQVILQAYWGGEPTPRAKALIVPPYQRRRALALEDHEELHANVGGLFEIGPVTITTPAGRRFKCSLKTAFCKACHAIEYRQVILRPGNVVNLALDIEAATGAELAEGVDCAEALPVLCNYMQDQTFPNEKIPQRFPNWFRGTKPDKRKTATAPDSPKKYHDWGFEVRQYEDYLQSLRKGEKSHPGIFIETILEGNHKRRYTKKKRAKLLERLYKVILE